MSIFHVYITTANAAFHDDDDNHSGGEIARILREIAERIDMSGRDQIDLVTILDYNGNRVGFWGWEVTS